MTDDDAPDPSHPDFYRGDGTDDRDDVAKVRDALETLSEAPRLTAHTRARQLQPGARVEQEVEPTNDAAEAYAELRELFTPDADDLTVENTLDRIRGDSTVSTADHRDTVAELTATIEQDRRRSAHRDLSRADETPYLDALEDLRAVAWVDDDTGIFGGGQR